MEEEIKTIPPSTEETSSIEGLYEQFATEAISAISLVVTAGFAVLVSHLRKKLKILSEKVGGVEENVVDRIIPPEEVKRLKEIFAQLAILYDADRVSLGVFHNGVIGARGARYEKIAIIEGYNSPGVIPLPEASKDVYATAIMNDFKPLWEGEGGKELIISRVKAPSSCTHYMSRRDIFHMWNIILCKDNIDIGMISIHWCSSQEKLPLPEKGSKSYIKAERLKQEITSIIQINKLRNKVIE